MKNTKNFPFEKSRRITTKEVQTARRAIEETTGKKRLARGRPTKTDTEKYQAISIRLHPKIIAWTKKEAKKQGIGYQTVINQILFNKLA